MKTLDYSVRRTGKPWDAKIFLNGKEDGELRKEKGVEFRLRRNDGTEWVLSPKVGGEVRPFSMVVREAPRTGEEGPEVLTIRDHLFKHGEKFYLVGGTPEGTPLREMLSGSKYICRLDSLPFRTMEEMDPHTLSRLRKTRGIPVGELSGIGLRGHHVKIGEELDDVGLQLAASCYLIYSTA